ncbi:DUF6879 family protein [Nocardia sp. NBC_01327]|uniref:DUF6879 family protein n=1 Tax=Nocardia sp. NBC_01327 TaxID=2903593 RepID=UPI002E0DDE09|nr:DUF6879 family protein [Nocardia sp. NBC_01327]WSJ16364.1 hypothetical protein OG326_02580 [Nocardia sp. NBC_01327]
MLLLPGKEFHGPFAACQREAFHLEVKDTYETPEESAPFGRFLAGEPDDYSWLEGWLDRVRAMTARGVRVRRARVVTVPHTDYTNFALEVAIQCNSAAGEEIRYLPRNRIDPSLLTTDDWWLMDDETVAFTVFESTGRFVGGAVTTDPRIAAYIREVRDRVWEHAVPLADYVPQRTR